MAHPSPMKDYETAAEIISIADANGLKVGVRKLARWQSEGLMPRPRQIHVPGVPGSVAVFPKGASGQLWATNEYFLLGYRFLMSRI
jgi:hypothetical protein